MSDGIRPERADKEATANFRERQIIDLENRITSLEAEKKYWVTKDKLAEVKTRLEADAKHWVTEGAFQEAQKKWIMWTVGALLTISGVLVALFKFWN